MPRPARSSAPHEVWPQIREYERTIVAILNAYVRPNVGRYLGSWSRTLGSAGVTVPLYITKSNGGVTTARDAARCDRPDAAVRPGVGRHRGQLRRHAGRLRDLITLDMGGTSADIALVRDGAAGVLQ